MWSGWPERVDVVLGVGTVLVKRRAQALVSLQPPATLPLGDVLVQVDEACGRGKGRPWRLHVALSAALCPPVAFTVPQGVKRWSETVALAQAAAAQAWGLPMDQAEALVCALDVGRPGLAAALMKGTHESISAWARRHGGHLVSLTPLLREPDALSVGQSGKPVQIQFVVPRAWKFIWSTTAVLLLALLGQSGWQAWAQHQLRRNLQAELAQLQAQLKVRSTPKSPEIDPRQASEQAALRLMQRDWNRVFDTIENPALAPVRLVQMSVDAETGETRLEYELETFAHASLVTTALNDPAASAVWRLERVDTGTMRQDVGGGRVRGVWSSTLP